MVHKPKTYGQNCPVALGMDLLGERWSMLILRELFGGPRRYSDLRLELPGIATNLLSERLRTLEHGGLIQRSDLPPPASRTVYGLTDAGWRNVAPVLKAVAAFGMKRIDVDDIEPKPLTGFIAGLIAGFDSCLASSADASYRVCIDDRVFEFSISDGELAPPRSMPAVVLSATALDLIMVRAALGAGQRRAALRRLRFEGEPAEVATMQEMFGLAA